MQTSHTKTLNPGIKPRALLLWGNSAKFQFYISKILMYYCITNQQACGDNNISLKPSSQFLSVLLGCLYKWFSSEYQEEGQKGYLGLGLGYPAGMFEPGRFEEQLQRAVR